MSGSYYREATQKALLELFAEITDLPLVLYELHNREPKGIYTERALGNFEPHCKLLHTFQGGKARCEQDQSMVRKFSLLGIKATSNADLRWGKRNL